jgi:high-affinity nickel-transport protein
LLQYILVAAHSDTVLSILSLLVLGFALGVRHATDPDHVVAVTTIAAGERSLRRASAIGALWGLGHSVTILAVGGAIVAFRLVIPPRLGLAMEFAVAVMLIVLGWTTLRGRVAPATDSVARPVAVGLVHGLAGSAFVAMLVVAAIPGVLAGFAYLAVFGVGTVAGMSLVTLAVCAPVVAAGDRFGSLHRHMRLASGVASVAFGLFLAHRVGFVDGLFLEHAVWRPE